MTNNKRGNHPGESADVGEAYLIFNSSAPEQQIQTALLEIQEEERTKDPPGGLELSLRKVKDVLHDDNTNPKILNYINQSTIYEAFGSDQQAGKAGARLIEMQDLRYLIKATYPGISNIETADRLGNLANWIYQTFDHPNPLARDIFFEHEGKICYRRK